jgi:hypothetical protein
MAAVARLPSPGSRRVVNLPVSWDAFAELTPVAANAFVFQFVPGPDGKPNEVILNVGFLGPPPLQGASTEEQLAHLKKLGGAAVRPIVRLTFSRERAQELRQITDQILNLIETASETRS